MKKIVFFCLFCELIFTTNLYAKNVDIDIPAQLGADCKKGEEQSCLDLGMT